MHIPNLSVKSDDTNSDDQRIDASPLPTKEDLKKEVFPLKRNPPQIERIRAPEGTPPRSPAHRSQSYVSYALPKRNKPIIPKFYFPKGPPCLPKEILKKREIIDQFFAEGDLTEKEFRLLLPPVVGLCTYFSLPLWQKCGAEKTISKQQFIQFWETWLEDTSDLNVRLFNIISQTNSNIIARNDLYPMLRDFVNRHPGLRFLESSPGFHKKYMETVVERMFFFHCCPHRDGITLNTLRKSNLLSTFNELDEQEDVNEIFDYFSYEHFYVIYCKFWELDEDHDFLLKSGDLFPYGDYAITQKVCQRILEVYGTPNEKNPDEKVLTYRDFIHFIIAEEDKTHIQSIRYWFRVLDRDCDGILSFHEIKYFWEDQAIKLQRISSEEFNFSNLQQQLKDMIPAAFSSNRMSRGFVLEDIKKSGLAPLFFNVLFNLSKFAVHEQRDPYRLEQIRQSPDMTDWDRFAQVEYLRYASEEEECNQ